jgi:hypothetical protein
MIGAGQAFLVEALSAIHTGAKGQRFDHAQSVAVRLPFSGWENEASFRIALPASYQPLHKNIWHRDHTLLPILWDEPEIAVLRNGVLFHVEVKVGPDGVLHFLLSGTGAQKEMKRVSLVWCREIEHRAKFVFVIWPHFFLRVSRHVVTLEYPLQSEVIQQRPDVLNAVADRARLVSPTPQERDEVKHVVSRDVLDARLLDSAGQNSGIAENVSKLGVPFPSQLRVHYRYRSISKLVERFKQEEAGF